MSTRSLIFFAMFSSVTIGLFDKTLASLGYDIHMAIEESLDFYAKLFPQDRVLYTQYVKGTGILPSAEAAIASLEAKSPTLHAAVKEFYDRQFKNADKIVQKIASRTAESWLRDL
uniref:DUF2059 domain-containing protein n=1 Tax=Steinernema glaseri TaxID=37863 RepID=A0A1I7ZGR5_9BILA